MHPIFRRGILKPAGWLALCYLGYWLAVAIDRIVVQGVAFPLLGMGATSWEITPFQITIANSTPEGLHSSLFLALALPLALELVFLAFLARWGTRFRSAFARTGIHFAGLWVVLLLAMHGSLLAYWGRLRFGQFYVQLAVLGPSRLPLRIVITLAATLLLLSFGGMCARRLLDDARKSLELGQGRRWFAVSLLILPVLVILSGAFRSAQARQQIPALGHGGSGVAGDSDRCGFEELLRTDPSREGTESGQGGDGPTPGDDRVSGSVSAKTVLGFRSQAALMTSWWSGESTDAPREENRGPGTWIAANDVWRRLIGTDGRLTESPEERFRGSD